MNIEKLQQFLEENKIPKFRFDQVKKAVFIDDVSSFLEITTLPKDLREKMESHLKLLSFEVKKVLIAKDKQSIKALLKLKDGEFIETVLISPKPAFLFSKKDTLSKAKRKTWSACISCQVGCAMGCRFCATGKIGFKRDLTAEEITDQILFWRQYLKGDFKMFENRKLEITNCNVISNIVYMGMGEPFNNWKNVSESIRNFIDKKLFGFGSRCLSVSTSGITEGIVKLAQEFPQVNLAISLHFARDEKRSRFMPVNKKDNMESLRNALKKYFQITKRKVFLEYIMLEGINDTALDARLLAEYVKSTGFRQLLHVNLIRYNTTSFELKPSSKNKTNFFKTELEKYHLSVTIRKSLGDEIKAACGQLAGN